MSCNANSINGKKVELIDLINTLNPDVIALQETFLSANKNFFIPNFKIYRRDRSDTGGGVAIAIHNRINHYPINLPTLQNLEAIGIAVKINPTKTINLISAYHPNL